MGIIYRGWQTAGAALVAACLGALALFGVRMAIQPHMADMRAAAADVPVTASVGFDTDDEGTVVLMRCEYHEIQGLLQAQDWTLTLVAVPKTGNVDEMVTWTAGYGDEYNMVAHTYFKRSDLARIEIRSDTGQALLTYSVT